MEPYRTNRRIAVAMAVDWVGVQRGEGGTGYHKAARMFNLVHALLSTASPEEELKETPGLPARARRKYKESSQGQARAWNAGANSFCGGTGQEFWRLGGCEQPDGIGAGASRAKIGRIISTILHSASREQGQRSTYNGLPVHGRSGWSRETQDEF